MPPHKSPVSTATCAKGSVCGRCSGCCYLLLNGTVFHQALQNRIVIGHSLGPGLRIIHSQDRTMVVGTGNS